MERSLHTPAIVIRHRNYEESDRFISFLTPYNGRISALAKGVRKLNSRKAGHLQPFTYVDVQLSQGKGASQLVTQVTTLEAFPMIWADLEKTVRTSCILELAERFSIEGETNPTLFRLTLDTIRRIAWIADAYPVQRFFDLQLLELSGYRPQLRQCVRCGKDVEPESQYISFREGGVLCPKCGASNRDARPISMRTLKYLRYYQGREFREAMAAGWPEDIRIESEQILTGYQSYILDRKTNSQKFLESM